jgi:acyl dehydratase
VTRGEVALLADLTWTIGATHTDRVFASGRPFGDITVAGGVLVAIATGLINTSDLYHELLDAHGVDVLAALGVEARYRHPLYPEDTVYVETTLESVRPSASRPAEEILTFSDRVVNQDERVLMEMRRSWRIRRRSPA